MNHRRGMRRASNYTSSGTISVEQQPTHYILDDGSTVPASSLIRLSDGTYAIIEDTSEGTHEYFARSHCNLYQQAKECTQKVKEAPFTQVKRQR